MLPEPSFPAQPVDFIGREDHIQYFRDSLRHSVITKRMASFAILGDWGIGKSSLLLKLAESCSGPEFRMLPVHFSVSQDIGDYLRFAESLCDKLADALAASDSMTNKLRTAVRNWKLKRLNAGALTLERDAPQRFLTSGSALLRHTLTEAWNQFVRPVQLAGAIFFLDDLHNLILPRNDTALIIRDQFQAFGIEGMNFSVCFSAKADYFSGIRSFAEPAVRFYNKLYLTPFSVAETLKYTEAAFGANRNVETLSHWLFEKSFGHPYFLAFITRQLLLRGQDSSFEDPANLWPEVFHQLEQEKFQADLSQLSDKDIALLRALAKANDQEFSPAPFARHFQYEYFRRLTDRGLLVRASRGRYKLYHPLFQVFLKQER